MTPRSLVTAVGFSAALLVLGCGTQYLDPIREQEEPAPAGDPCGTWLTEAECRADTANGCSFQPNTVGCLSSDPGCAPGVCRGGDPFVRRSGQTLTLHGAPYAFLGAVSWGVTWSPECQLWSMPSQAEAIDRTFDDLVQLRANALKIWAFQTYAGTSGADYSSFERVIAGARRAGVRLIFVLENHWPDCSREPERDDAWYGSGFRSPYGGNVLSYEDYARALVAHFRDEPAILAWELVHEAHGEDFAAMDTFAATMATVVRGNDPNHLVALGIDNGDSAATSRSGDGSSYARLHAHDGIDLLDVHDFWNYESALTVQMSEITGIAAGLNKAMFAGATGLDVPDTSTAALGRRAESIESKLLAARAGGFVGFLMFDHFPDWNPPGTNFDARTTDPLGGPDGVFARHAVLNPP